MLPILYHSTLHESAKSLQTSKSNDSNISQQTHMCNCSEIKSQLRIQVCGNTEELITCNGVNTADSIANLIDGYCKIFNENNLSVWDKSTNTFCLETKNHEEKILDTFENYPKIPLLNDDYSELHSAHPEVDEEGDYSTPTARNYELQRNQIILSEIIGVGQFGDVFIGSCQIARCAKKDNLNMEHESIVSVAVKTCKPEADLKTSEKFLEEACEINKSFES